MLARYNPYYFDSQIQFEDQCHKYTVEGVPVKISVTGLISQQLNERFDPDNVIKKNLSKWRSNTSSKYYDTIHGLKDDDAAVAIKALWSQSASQGTRMHAILESYLNEEEIDPVDAEEFKIELKQFKALQKKYFYHLRILRTELRLYGKNATGEPVIAGSIDLLARNEIAGKLVLLDFKRTNHSLLSEEPSYGKTIGAFPAFPANDHYKYSIQLHIYKQLFERLCPDEVVETCFLIQMHPLLETGKVVRCAWMSEKAKSMLENLGVQTTPACQKRRRNANEEYTSS